MNRDQFGPTSEGDDTEHAIEYASKEESRASIQTLSEDDYRKLMIVASYFCRQRRLRFEHLEPGELLREAILRTLSGERRWRKGAVDMLRHLDRTMESISGHVVAQIVAEREFSDEVIAGELDTRTDLPRRSLRPTAESQLLAKEKIGRIEGIFAEAPVALAVLREKAQGYTESEIIARLGIDKRTFEAARKRIERELAKYALNDKERRS